MTITRRILILKATMVMRHCNLYWFTLFDPHNIDHTEVERPSLPTLFRDMANDYWPRLRLAPFPQKLNKLCWKILQQWWKGLAYMCAAIVYAIYICNGCSFHCIGAIILGCRVILDHSSGYSCVYAAVTWQVFGFYTKAGLWSFQLIFDWNWWWV